MPTPEMNANNLMNALSASVYKVHYADMDNATDLDRTEIDRLIWRQGIFIEMWDKGYCADENILKWIEENNYVKQSGGWSKIKMMDKITDLTERHNNCKYKLSTIACALVLLSSTIDENKGRYFKAFNKKYLKRIHNYCAKPITYAAKQELLKHLNEDVVSYIMEFDDGLPLLDQISKPTGITYQDILNTTDITETISFLEHHSTDSSPHKQEEMEKGFKYVVESYIYHKTKLSSMDTFTGFTAQMFVDELKFDLEALHNNPSHTNKEHPESVFDEIHSDAAHSRLGYYYEQNNSDRFTRQEWEYLLSCNKMSSCIFHAMCLQARLKHQDKQRFTSMIPFSPIPHNPNALTPNSKTLLVKKYQFLYPHEYVSFKCLPYLYQFDRHIKPYYYMIYGIQIATHGDPELKYITHPKQDSVVKRHTWIGRKKFEIENAKSKEIISKLQPLLARFELVKTFEYICETMIRSAIRDYAVIPFNIPLNMFKVINYIGEMCENNKRGGANKLWKHISKIMKIEGRTKMMTQEKRPELKQAVKKELVALYKYY